MSNPQLQSAAQAPESDLRLISALVYGLYLFALCNGITALIGVVIAYVKRGGARGTIYESHFSNAITVFWTTAIFFVLLVAMFGAGVVGLLSMFGPDIWHSSFWNIHGHWDGDNDTTWDHVSLWPLHGWWPLLAFFPIAHIGLVVLAVWWLYRVMRGLIHALEGRPY
ncbi:MAG TPA: hypothetical protein VGG10_06895 [Rhizomicrobium sp.]|jgi:uncharacterized membrane protein